MDASKTCDSFAIQGLERFRECQDVDNVTRGMGMATGPRKSTRQREEGVLRTPVIAMLKKAHGEVHFVLQTLNPINSS